MTAICLPGMDRHGWRDKVDSGYGFPLSTGHGRFHLIDRGHLKQRAKRNRCTCSACFFCINGYMNTENRPLYPPSPVFVAGSVKNPGCKAGVFLKIEENNDLQKWGSSPGEILYIYFAELVLRHVCVDLCG